MNSTIEQSIELNASIEKVWDALTDYQKFGEWFRVKVEEPFVVGKESQGYMTYPGYEHVKWKAIIKKLEPKHFFSFTWHPYAVDNDKDYSQEMPTLVEFKLQEISVGTLLTVTESGFDKLPKERYAEAFRMHENGWAEQLENIKHYVSKH